MCEPSFGEAALALVDKLVAMGFEEDEARGSIEPMQEELVDPGGLFDPREKPKPTFRHTVDGTREVLSALKEEAPEGVTARETEDGKVEIAVAGWVSGGLEKAIYKFLPEAERTGAMEAIEKYRTEIRDRVSPAERGEKLDVPRLTAEIQGTLGFADADVFMEFHDWSLLDHPPRMDEGEFAIRETAISFEIDIEGKRVTYQFAGEEEQLALNVDVEGWTPEGLALWLDRQVRQSDIGQSELLKWLGDLVRHLVTARGIHISALMRCKFILARKIRDRIDAIRQKERDAIYQRFLFAPEAKPEISFDHAFVFQDGMYRDEQRYRGRWKPSRHFLGPDRVPAFDGVDDGEEFRCAQEIDSLPGLKYWIRNVAKNPGSFGCRPRPTSSTRISSLSWMTGVSSWSSTRARLSPRGAIRRRSGPLGSFGRRRAAGSVSSS